MDRMMATAGVAALDGQARGGWLEVSVTPTPARGLPCLRLNVPQPSRIEITIYDSRGRSVLDRDLGRIAAGLHVVPLSEPGSGGRGFSPGVYFYTVRSGQSAVTGKIVLLQ